MSKTLTRRGLLAATSVFVLSLALVSFATGREVQPEVPIGSSPNPPTWVKVSSRCTVDLTDPGHPSGVVGYIGHNASLLSIIHRSHVSCVAARRFARAAWTRGPNGQRLHWRYRRAWRSTAGSAYVGDFLGASGSRRVEFLAVH
jgi:hypothetical protein